MMLEKKLKQYAKRFKDGFPMIPLGWSRTDEQIIEIIDECLKEGKDVYELGLVTDSEEVIY